MRVGTILGSALRRQQEAVGKASARLVGVGFLD